MSQSMYITSSSPEKQPKNVFVFSIKIQLLKTSNNTSAPLLFCFVFVLILFFTQSFTMRYDGSYHELGEISQITELSEFSKITSFYFKARQRINSPVYQCLLADTNVSSLYFYLHLFLVLYPSPCHCSFFFFFFRCHFSL